MKSQKEEGSGRRLLEVISCDNLFYLFEWMVEHLKTYLKMITQDISSENSPHIEEQTLENSRVTVTPGEKMMILQLTELIRIIHSLECTKIQLI